MLPQSRHVRPELTRLRRGRWTYSAPPWYLRCPLASQRNHFVEASTANDARAIVKDHLQDFGDLANFTYTVKPYVAPPPGHIVGRFEVAT